MLKLFKRWVHAAQHTPFGAYYGEQSRDSNRSGKGEETMNKALWGVQILIGLAFIMFGGMKLVTPAETLAVDMNWVNYFPAMVVKLIGLLELLGGLGLILPSVTRIKPELTPLAAGGPRLDHAGRGRDPYRYR